MRPAQAPETGGGKKAVAEVRPRPVVPPIRKRRIERAARLRTLGFASYPDYLRSSTWAKVKAAYRASDRPQACECGEENVHLHHLTYERVGGEELLTDLIPLCPNCHALVHTLERRGDIGIDMSGLHDPERAAEYHAEQADREAYREMQREQFHALPDSERLRRLELAAREHGYTSPLRNHLRAINRQMRQAEEKIARGLSAQPIVSSMDRTMRRAERALTDGRPDSLDDLAA